MSSVRWMNLDTRIIIGLYDGTSGGGASYTNIMRRGPENTYEGVSSLAQYAMQDKVSSFKIMEQLPAYETIDKIEFDLRNFPRKSVTIESKGSVQGTQIASSYAANVSPGTTLYRRVEEVKGVLQGSFRYDTASTFVTTPL